MILAVIYGVLIGTAFVMIAYTCASMFCRWAFAGQKLPKREKKESFDEAMKRYKELEYNNSLNDN